MAKTKTVILGAGKSGLAMVRYLAQEDHIIVLDSSKSLHSEQINELASLGVDYLTGSETELTICNYDRLLLSPGIPMDTPLVQEAMNLGIPTYGEIEFAYQECYKRFPTSKIFAITGTNGKSTTTHLLEALIKGSGQHAVACGNIGIPFTEALDSARPDTFFCLEVSSYQLESIQRFRADIATILNITPDHLARHKTMENYRNMKLRIFSNQKEGDIRISPYNNSNLSIADQQGVRNLYFSLAPIDVAGSYLDTHGNICLNLTGNHSETIIHKDQILIPGQHNIENILVACLMAALAGVSTDAIKKSLKVYKGLKHRLSFFAEYEGIRFINDSKATNVDSTVVALQALSGPIILLLGGTHKGSSYKTLIPHLKNRISHLLFLGEAIPYLEEDLGLFPYESIYSFKEAVERALVIAEKGTTILLSPACASFDQFHDFEARGEAFEQIITAWINAQYPKLQ